MKLPALYQLADEYLIAADRLSALDLPDEVVRDTLEGLSGALEEKAVNVAMLCRNLETSAEQIKAAEEAMAARRKALHNRAARLKEYLRYNMERAGIQKIDCPYFSLSVRKNPPAVVVDAANLIPERFWRHPPPPPAEVDKQSIVQAIKAGEEVHGAHLEQGSRLDIK